MTVDGQRIGAIGAGLLVLLGVHHTDTPAEADWLARKTAHLRIFRDSPPRPGGDAGRMNRSLLDVGGAALVVSQFTLYADVQKGARPSYIAAAPPDVAEPLYRHYVATLQNHLGQPVPTGVFGAMMEVQSINDGPVTLWVERRAQEA